MATSIVSKLSAFLAAWALAGAVAPGRAATAKAPLEEPVTYDNAGITIAVPKGFEQRIISAPFDVFSATVEESGQAVKAVTLAAFPITQGVSAEEFAEGKMAELARNVQIRNLKTARKTAMKVAGADGAVRLVSYTFRGTDSVAAQVYFLRDIAGSPNRICYLLTVVTTASRKAELIPALGGVVGSVAFVPVKEPRIAEAPPLDERVVTDAAMGFSFRPPKGWYIDRSGGGVEVGLVNYLQGGIPLPSVKLTAAIAPDEATSQSASAKYLTLLTSAAVQNKQTTRTVSDANATLGGLPAWQFVLQIMERHSPIPSLSGKRAEDVVVIHRTACLTRPDSPNIAYTVTITTQVSQRAAAVRLMDALAEAFTATGPASRPAEPTTTTAPATKPATAPAPAANLLE